MHRDARPASCTRPTLFQPRHVQSYGTASYAAPELLSQGKLTKAADVYSLGIISESFKARLVRNFNLCG